MSSIYNYLEWVSDGSSPSTMSFSLSEGTANETYLLKNQVIDVEDLYNFFKEMVGDVEQDPSTWGGLIRTNPIRHPFMPYYCVGISGVSGFGQPYDQISNPPVPFVPEIPNWCQYENWKFNAVFKPAPFNILSDEVIGDGIEGTYYSERNGGQNAQTFTYWKEWERNVDWMPAPSDDNVVQQFGNLVFNCIDLPEDGRLFNAQPRLFLQNQHIVFTWTNVPFTYVSSPKSYINNFRGRINQNRWTTSTFGTYEAGSLLYTGYKVKKYTSFLGNNTYTIPGTSITEYQKNCDIELMFMNTSRVIYEVPLNEPSNLNYVTNGFNAQPYLGNANDPLSRTFLYASTAPTASPNSVPQWLSMPVELLFTNPDFVDNATFQI